MASVSVPGKGEGKGKGKGKLSVGKAKEEAAAQKEKSPTKTQPQSKAEMRKPKLDARWVATQTVVIQADVHRHPTPPQPSTQDDEPAEVIIRKGGVEYKVDASIQIFTDQDELSLMVSYKHVVAFD